MAGNVVLGEFRRAGGHGLLHHSTDVRITAGANIVHTRDGDPEQYLLLHFKVKLE